MNHNHCVFSYNLSDLYERILMYRQLLLLPLVYESLLLLLLSTFPRTHRRRNRRCPRSCVRAAFLTLARASSSIIFSTSRIFVIFSVIAFFVTSLCDRQHRASSAFLSSKTAVRRLRTTRSDVIIITVRLDVLK